MMKSEIHKPDTFLYLSYATNMLKFRVRMFCPTAEFVSIARLDNFRLDFNKLNKFWEGPVATVVPTANAHVWGVIWRVHKDDLESLDNFRRYRCCGLSYESKFIQTAHIYLERPDFFTKYDNEDFFKRFSQRDIDSKKFFVINVEVLTPHMDKLTCRSYMQKVYPLPKGNRDPIPVEQRPSWSYKQIIIMGAKENGLPPYYIRFLRKLKDNGNEGYIRADCLLMRYGKDVPCDCRLPTIILREPLKIYLKGIKEKKRSIKIV